MSGINAQRFTDSYNEAMERGRGRFRLLSEALTRECGLDVEPVVDQTGGMVLCLAIHWPDGKGWVWVSDWWWQELIVCTYEFDEDEGTCPVPPDRLTAMLLPEDMPPPANGEQLAEAIAKWAAPFIAAHGRRHGWERRS